jgi:hypothetical protein
MHILFKSKIQLNEDYPDLSYETQLNDIIKSMRKGQIEILSSEGRTHLETIRLIDNNHVNYFINFMLKYSGELNLKVTYYFQPQEFLIDFWLERQ